MDTFLCIAALVAGESLFIVWLALKDPAGPVIAIKLNMIMIALFAPALISIGGAVTNVGNIFYASVVCCQCVLLATRGAASARLSIR